MPTSTCFGLTRLTDSDHTPFLSECKQDEDEKEVDIPPTKLEPPLLESGWGFLFLAGW